MADLGKLVIGSTWLLMSLAWSVSHAQTVVAADDVEFQLQVSRDSEGFSVCGIRAILVVLPPGKQTVSGAESIDFSLMMSRGQWHALSKFGAHEYVTGKTSENSKLITRAPAPIKFSIVPALDSKPFIPKKYIPADDHGFTLGIGDIGTAATALSEMAHGTQMHAVVRYANEKIDRTISFQSQLKSNERDVLFKCFDEFHSVLKSQAELKR